ncbi:copia protein [Tanacetum coccineum]
MLKTENNYKNYLYAIEGSQTALNIDHSQDFVRKDFCDWLRWLRKKIRYDGWRLGYVHGFWGGYVKEYTKESDYIPQLAELMVQFNKKHKIFNLKGIAQVTERVDVCVEDEMINYLNRRDVHRDMHAHLVGVHKWEVCRNILDYESLTIEIATINIVGSFIKEGVRVLVYRSVVSRGESYVINLTSLSLDELIGNLKVHEMIIKKDSEIVKAKGERKSLALKAKKESSNEECSTSGNKNERAFIGGSWSDSGEEDDEKVKDETCLAAQASSDICLGVDLEPDEWIKDSGSFRSFFGEEHQTFKLKMFHNLDQLRLQLERENLHGVNAKTCLQALRTQFKEFLASKGENGSQLHDEILHEHQIKSSVKMQSQDIQINPVQAMDDSLIVSKSSLIEPENNNAFSKSEIETQMQRQEEKVNMREAVDAGLVVTESSGTKPDKP